MATKSKQKESEVEVDETEKKAKAIGKEIGVEEDEKPDDTPDYEIEEEPNTSTTKVDDEEEDDKPLAKNKEREKEEKSDEDKTDKKKRQDLSNREKRALRKKRINERFNEKDTQIARLSEENLALKRRQDETDKRLHGMNKAELERAFTEAQNNFRQAEEASLTAFQEGDGVKHLRALQIMKDADDRMKLLRDTYNKLEQLPDREAQQKTRQEPPKHDARVISQKNRWAEKNQWFDPAGADEDSAIAITLAGVLVKEGFDPTTKDYWDELDDRLTERGARGAEREEEEEEASDDDDAPRQQQTKKRGGPPLSTSSRREEVNGKKTIRLPTDYVEKMKREAPEIWNDPKRRKKVLEDRARILRESGQ